MNRLVIGSAALAALMAVGAAHAADMPVKAPAYKPPPVPIYSWTGFYVGLNGGYGWDRGTIELSAIFPGFFGFYAPALANGAIPASSQPHARGFIGGLQAGYNYQSGSVVYGLESDISYAHLRGTAVNVSSAAGPILTTVQEQKLDWLGTLRGRAGILAVPSVLAYLTAGLAFGHAEASTVTTRDVTAVSSCANNLFCNVGTGSKTLFGWTVGGGLESALGPDWTVKAEYLYYDLGRISFTAITIDIGDPPTPVMQAEARFKGRIARVGINYRFGGPLVAKY